MKMLGQGLACSSLHVPLQISQHPAFLPHPAYLLQEASLDYLPGSSWTLSQKHFLPTYLSRVQVIFLKNMDSCLFWCFVLFFMFSVPVSSIEQR